MVDIFKPDLCVIGAGAAGIAAATLARSHGAEVILVDTGAETGDSLRAGAVPTAALAAAAGRAQGLRTANLFGMTNDEPRPNFRAVHDHVQAAIATLAPRDGVERLRALGIVVIAAPAAFVDGRTLKAGEALIRARRFMLATGSHPFVPTITGLDRVPFFTPDSIFANTHKLTHLVVIGGGGDALALAQSYRRLGAQVTLVAGGPILPDIDRELLDIALRRLREEGVAILADAEPVEIVPRSQGIGVNIRHEDGTEEALDASHILVAAGRQPILDDLGLDRAGLRRDRAHPERLALNRALRSSNRRVYAIGDAAWAGQSTHAAIHQAGRVLDHALFGRRARLDPAAVPHLIATDPEIAQIGLTEPQLRRRKIAYLVVRAGFSENERAIASQQTYGTAKLMTDRRGVILGAAVVGPGAGELIGLLALAMANRIAAPELAGLLTPYPSFAAIVARLGQAWREQAGPGPWRRRLLGLARYLP